MIHPLSTLAQRGKGDADYLGVELIYQSLVVLHLDGFLVLSQLFDLR